MNHSTCAVCGSNFVSGISYRNKWSELFNNKKILVCNTCGFGRIEPKIDSEIIIDFYKNIYRSKISPHHVDFSKKLSNQFFYRSKSISQLLLGRQYLQYKKKYNFLDIGAGLGKSFISAKEFFHGNVNIYAIEEDKAAKNYYQKNFKEVTISKSITDFKEFIDIVLMSHSLEHFDIDDMKQLFKDIHNSMNDKGIMIIEVPHADFRDKDYEKNRPKDTPHLSFFSLESLRKLVESFDFEICFIDTAGPLLEDLHLQDSPNKHRTVSFLRKVLKRLHLHSILARLKRNIYLKIREYLGRDKLYYHDNFQYRGNRTFLRCILRKTKNNL